MLILLHFWTTTEEIVKLNNALHNNIQPLAGEVSVTYEYIATLPKDSLFHFFFLLVKIAQVC